MLYPTSTEVDYLEDTLLFNIVNDDEPCSTYNGRTYRDSMELILELVQQNESNINSNEIEILVLKIYNDFLPYLRSLEQELLVESEEKQKNYKYESFEFIMKNRRVYHIPNNHTKSFKADMLNIIMEFSYESERKKISRY
jgi:hypothetical protein